MTDGRSSGGSENSRSPSDLLRLWIDARDQPEDEAVTETAAEPAAAEVASDAVDTGTTDDVEHTEWWPYADPDDAGATGAHAERGSSRASVAADSPTPPIEPAPPAQPAHAAQPLQEEYVDADVSEVDAEAALELEMNSTATWSLEDFERYIRAQHEGSPEAEFAAPEPEPVAPEPVAPEPAEHQPEPVVTETFVAEPEQPEQPEQPVADEVAEQVWPEPLPEPEREPTSDSATEAPTDRASAPSLTEDEAIAAIDLGKATATDPDLAPEPPSAPGPVLGLAPEPSTEAPAAPEGHAAPAPEPPDVFQEWFDDEGLRWVSRDGGYVWFSDRGEGWNAEFGESIEVPPDWRQPPRADGTPVEFPGTPAPAPERELIPETPRAAEPEPVPVPTPEPQPAPAPAPPEPSAVVEPPALEAPQAPEDAEETDERAAGLAPSWLAAGTEEVTVTPVAGRGASGWPDPVDGGLMSAAGAAAAEEHTDERWPSGGPATEAMPSLPATPAPTADETDQGGAPAYPLYADEAAVRRTASTSADPVGADGDRDDDLDDDLDEVPQFREYKPRGIYKPLLSLVLVLAALAAVVAVIWAVTQRNYVATGIAAGVTFFVAVFWWAVLSWNPSVVTVDGPVVEVSRGSDGERFDLRSPRLDIRVEDDPGTRRWRTTIVRPNGTELVIPASSVDAREFTRIVAHYRKNLPH